MEHLLEPENFTIKNLKSVLAGLEKSEKMPAYAKVLRYLRIARRHTTESGFEGGLTPGFLWELESICLFVHSVLPYEGDCILTVFSSSKSNFSFADTPFFLGHRLECKRSMRAKEFVEEMGRNKKLTSQQTNICCSMIYVALQFRHLTEESCEIFSKILESRKLFVMWDDNWLLNYEIQKKFSIATIRYHIKKGECATHDEISFAIALLGYKKICEDFIQSKAKAFESVYHPRIECSCISMVIYGSEVPITNQRCVCKYKGVLDAVSGIEVLVDWKNTRDNRGRTIYEIVPPRDMRLLKKTIGYKDPEKILGSLWTFRTDPLGDIDRTFHGRV